MLVALGLLIPLRETVAATVSSLPVLEAAPELFGGGVAFALLVGFFTLEVWVYAREERASE